MKRRYKAPRKRDKGVVYIIKIFMGNKVYIKIGATGRVLRQRVLEIIDSIYLVAKVFPKVVVLKEGVAKSYYEVEAKLHSKYRANKVSVDDRISGHSEFFIFEDTVDLFATYTELITLDAPPKVENIEM